MKALYLNLSNFNEPILDVLGSGYQDTMTMVLSLT